MNANDTAYRDPRGPIRKVTHVGEIVNRRGENNSYGDALLVTLDCGHVVDRNPYFTYRVGEHQHCMTCKSLGNT